MDRIVVLIPVEQYKGQRQNADTSGIHCRCKKKSGGKGGQEKAEG